MRFQWRALADDGRWFVYSPRFGATYLLGSAEVRNDLLLKLLGLPAAARVDELADPVVRVGMGGRHEKAIPPEEVAAWGGSASDDIVANLARWYDRLHRHRWRYAPANLEHWRHRIVASLAPAATGLERIGQLVALAEARAGVADCYPRSLLLGALCGSARIACEITIGILAPTRKLHAWCTAQGTLIYEPTPRHWWYRPLASFRYHSGDGVCTGQ